MSKLMINDLYKFINIPKSKKISKFYTYGEILTESVNKLLDHINTTDINFLDIGSGIGKIVIQVSLEYPIKISHGIELNKKRYLLSETVHNNLNEDIKKKIHFYNNNVFDFKNLEYDVIIFSNICFSENQNEKIGNMLSKNKNTILICLKKINNLNDFFKYSICNIKTSWSENETAYYYYIINK